MLSAIGGNNPQALMHDACLAISRGDLDVVLVTGAEAMYARALARRDPAGRGSSGRASRRARRHPSSSVWRRPGATELEMQRGVLLPVHAYPLFENALRARQRMDARRSTRARIGALWSRFSEVAAGNPDAWIRTPARPTRSSPRAGQPDGLVPLSRSSARPTCRSTRARPTSCARWRRPAPPGCPRNAGSSRSRARTPTTTGSSRSGPSCTAPRPSGYAGAAALELAGLGIDDVASVDLYSCFPVVVQMAAAELGLAVDDPTRPLTLTGGLTFGGGPGNNYTSHGIARAVGALRAAPGTAALVTGLGWYATKHSIGVYASRPPAHGGTQPFAWRDVQPEVDALPQCAVDAGGDGPGARRDLHRHLRPRGHARARHPGLPDGRRQPGLGQRHRSPTPWRSSAPRRASAARGVLAIDGTLTLDE